MADNAGVKAAQAALRFYVWWGARAVRISDAVWLVSAVLGAIGMVLLLAGFPDDRVISVMALSIGLDLVFIGGSNILLFASAYLSALILRLSGGVLVHLLDDGGKPRVQIIAPTPEHPVVGRGEAEAWCRGRGIRVIRKWWWP